MRSAKLILLLLLLMICWGCTARWYFKPVKSERPVTMFNGKYVLKMFGVQGASHSSISEFINSVELIGFATDAQLISLDTIPIFALDSVCFEGGCLDPAFCRRPTLIIEDYMQLNEDSSVSFLELSEKQYPHWKRKLVWPPGSLFSGYNIRVPLSCEDQSVFVLFYARLINRNSGKTISKEVKSVIFEVRMSKVIYTSG